MELELGDALGRGPGAAQAVDDVAGRRDGQTAVGKRGAETIPAESLETFAVVGSHGTGRVDGVTLVAKALGFDVGGWGGHQEAGLAGDGGSDGLGEGGWCDR